MVDIEYVNPGTPVAGPYTPAVKLGNLIFVSGQGPAAGTDNIEDQTRSELEKIKTIVESAGSSVSEIVKTTVFLKNVKDFDKMNQIYKQFFEENGASGKYPARSTVEVSNLPGPTMLIEIDAIAAIK
ncbi:MAG: RidA family protein [Candidatus Hermodarchaeota archaeon]